MSVSASSGSVLMVPRSLRPHAVGELVAVQLDDVGDAVAAVSGDEGSVPRKNSSKSDSPSASVSTESIRDFTDLSVSEPVHVRCRAHCFHPSYAGAGDHQGLDVVGEIDAVLVCERVGQRGEEDGKAGPTTIVAVSQHVVIGVGRQATPGRGHVDEGPRDELGVGIEGDVIELQGRRRGHDAARGIHDEPLSPHRPAGLLHGVGQPVAVGILVVAVGRVETDLLLEAVGERSPSVSGLSGSVVRVIVLPSVIRAMPNPFSSLASVMPSPSVSSRIGSRTQSDAPPF